MNGANAEPCVKIINAPKRIKKIMIGASHHFLRSLKKDQSSFRIEILLMINNLLLKS